VYELSLAASSPVLAEVAKLDRSLMRGARAKLKARGITEQVPMFNTPRGGMGVIVDSLVHQLRSAGVNLRCNAGVDALRAQDRGWSVDVEHGERMEADAVILAVPAFDAAALMKPFAPEASELLRTVRYASVAIIRLAYATASIARPLDGSGYVAVGADGGLLTACSWASSKWQHLQHPGQVVLRASVGRMHDTRAGELSDDELIGAVHNELTKSLGAKRRPFAADVTRWPNSFPQYEVGHQKRVIEIERLIASAGTLTLAGAAYRGLGIPACIKDGVDAAETVLGRLPTKPRQTRVSP